MTKKIWINLPVKDVKKSKVFFSQLGFSFNEEQSREDISACMLVGNEKIVVMLFKEEFFSGFSQNKISQPEQGTEVLLSIDAESRAEVDEMAKKADAAGGHIFGKPGESQGWLYGCGFSDLDGHRWNVLFMDLTKIPKT
jgi:predicted lactoylglutathione lyase